MRRAVINQLLNDVDSPTADQWLIARGLGKEVCDFMGVPDQRDSRYGENRYAVIGSALIDTLKSQDLLLLALAAAREPELKGIEMGALTEERLIMLLANVFEAQNRGAERVSLDVVSVRALIADYNGFALQLKELKADYSPEREDNRVKTLEARLSQIALIAAGHNK